MSANLTPQYFKAEERYKAAHEDHERLLALREMMSTIPKHKGTEKLQADIKRKIAQLRTHSSRKGGPHRAPSHGVERSGAAQIVLVGPANSGKSRLVADHTHAHPEVAPYPFTTWTPTPGIYEVDNIPLQVVDLPPLTAEHVEPWMADLLRNTDLLLILMDVGSDEVLDDWEAVLAGLEAVKVSIEPKPPPGEREVGTCYLPFVIAANKIDLPGARTRRQLLQEVVGPEKHLHPVSLETEEGLHDLLAEVIHELDLVRVYTKEPHEEADMSEPFVLRRGSTVQDVARVIHKELADHFKFARAWGERFHDGQPVGRDTALEDGDVLEFHE